MIDLCSRLKGACLAHNPEEHLFRIQLVAVTRPILLSKMYSSAEPCLF